MARMTRDDVDRFFDHGLNVPTRTFYLGDNDEGLDGAVAAQIIRALHVLDASDGPITVKMNSGGGDVYHGLAIYDAIKTCRNEVTIIAYGHVMSMGLIVLQAADRRILSEHTSVMWHYGSDGFAGHAKDLERRAEESKRLGKALNGILLPRVQEKHPGFSEARFKSKFEFDTFMSAQTAIDFGFADAILT